MKLVDILLFVVAFCMLIIGIHQSIVVGLPESYWIFMFSLMPLFLYGYRKGRKADEQKSRVKPTQTGKKKKRK